MSPELIEVVHDETFLLQSAAMLERGVPHGFLGNSIDALSEQQKLEAFLRKMFRPKEPRLHFLRQTHSATVISFPNVAPHAECEGDAWLYGPASLTAHPSADISSQETFSLLGIKTADCSPVILATRNGTTVSVIHCGWRGTVDGILLNALTCFQQMGIRQQDIFAAIGPAARSCCYEVGEDLAQTFFNLEMNTAGKHNLRQSAVSRRNDMYFLDIPVFLQNQLEEFGVPVANISITKLCTICDFRFFSYRRQKDVSGRQVSFVGRSRDGAFH